MFNVQACKSNKISEFDESGLSTVLLYLGLGLVTMGLGITLVGVGDKGFKTFQLKLLGPALLSCGGVMFLVRLLVCTVGMGREEGGGGEE